MTSDYCRVTVQWLFSKNFLIAWNLQKTLFDSRPTVAWPPTTVAWPFSDFFQKNSKLLETSEKRCLTVGRRSRDLRPLLRDRSVTFFKNFPNCLKPPKNVVWQSADGRVTTDHYHVTVQGLFSKFRQIAWNVQKTLFDSRPTVAWPTTTVAWPFSDFFQKNSKLLETSKKRCSTVGRRSRDLRPLSRDRSVTFFKIFPNCWKRPKNVIWQSADGRVTSDHCRVTTQRFFSKIFLVAWHVQKTLFDSRPTVAWPPTTVAWPSSDFFKLFPNCLKRPKNVVWQSADGRVTSDHCRVTVQRLFSKKFQIAWNVQKTLFDSRPTVAWPPTTVAWPFSDFFQKMSKLLETFKKSCLTVGRRSRDLRPLSRDRSVTFFNKFPNCLERPKNVVWQSADGRVTSDHCRGTVQWLFSKKFQIAWNVRKTFFDSRPTVAWPPTTVVWSFSDFFQKNSKLLETSEKRFLTVGRRSRDLRPLSCDRSVTLQKFF